MHATLGPQKLGNRSAKASAYLATLNDLTELRELLLTVQNEP